MSRLRIALCNERFIFRFGVDRILLTLAKSLIADGHDVHLLSFRCDDAVREAFRDRLTLVGRKYGDDFYALERAGADALRSILHEESCRGSKIDVVVSGGWPFFSAALVGLQNSTPTIFIDAGAVPHDGLSGGLLSIQQAVRRVRSASLAHFTAVLPISDFIRETQSIPDRGTEQGVKVVRLGVDHLSDAFFEAEARAATQEPALVDKVREWADEGGGLILNLGRYEKLGYKNSPAALHVHNALLAKFPRARLLVLDDGREVDLPWSQSKNVECIGHVSDATLVALMKLADAGVSVSQWEGFNLPLGEMQLLGKPVVAFNVGAHPEVIAHPWLLVSSEQEMVAKLEAILLKKAPAVVSESLRSWSSRVEFKWSTATATYLRSLLDIGSSPAVVQQASARPLVIADVTNSSSDPANTGVTRVTRRLLGELQRASEIDLIYVWWDKDTGEYRFLDDTRRQYLSGYGGPRDALSQIPTTLGAPFLPATLVDWLGSGAQSGATLLVAEIAMDGYSTARMAWAKARGLKVVSILYDLIPINHPELCNPRIARDFPPYLKSVAEGDTVIAISQTTLDDFEQYMAERQEPMPATSCVIWLPGQFGDLPRKEWIDHERIGETRGAPRPTNGKWWPTRQVEMLCVATLEPRKNHRRLIEAFHILKAKRGDLQLKLTLIGNRYDSAPDIAEFVEEACRSDSSISWLGFQSDEAIAAAFSRASFVVYPSLVEGFGLPILESIWMGRPCICHDDGVMRELASPGGCLTVDVRDASKLASAMERLATDDALLTRLGADAAARTIPKWEDYAASVASVLAERREASVRPKAATPASELTDALHASYQPTVRRLMALASLLHDSVAPPPVEAIPTSGEVLGPITARNLLKYYVGLRSTKSDTLGRALAQAMRARRQLVRFGRFERTQK